MDTRAVSSFADYFVICSGESDKQVKAIYEEIEHELEKDGVSALHHEGSADSGWMLLDYGDIVVHIFSPKERDFYQLEKLWSTAKPVLHIQ
ncbi:MAG: ribosome silencing factor [Dehalococcoidales bacterium]|nr:ribosome silencing factor [Dehalococcoidales bacterium]